MTNLVSAFVAVPSPQAALEVVCRRLGPLAAGMRVSNSIELLVDSRGTFTNKDHTGYSYKAGVAVEFLFPKGTLERIFPDTEISDEWTWDATLTADQVTQLIDQASQIKMLVIPRE